MDRMIGGDTLEREVARRSVERLGSGLTRLVEESAALFRWSLTMLVFLNGAALYGAIAVSGMIDPAMFRQLMLIFFAGMMTALLAAFAGILLMLPVAGATRRAIMHWTEVSLSGALTDEAVTSSRRVRRASSLWLTVMALVALCSLALFAAGSLMLGERFGIVGPPGEPASAQAAPEESGLVLGNAVAAAMPENVAESAAIEAPPEPPLEAAVPAPVPPKPTPVAKPVAKPASQAAAKPAPKAQPKPTQTVKAQPTPRPAPPPVRPSPPAASVAPAPPAYSPPVPSITPATLTPE